jgi:hypothetical protein
MSCIIRRATPDDRPAILALAGEQAAASPAGDALVAEVGGQVIGAIALHDGRMVGDAARCGARLRERRMRVLTARHFAHAAKAA